MEEALRSLLLLTVPVAAIVERRIDWGVRPPGDAMPGITLNRATSVLMMNLAGQAGWQRDRIQIDVWGRTFKAARDLGDVLAGRQGVLTGMRRDVDDIRLRTIIVGRRSGTDEDANGPIHRDSIDVMVWHAAF